MLSDPGSEGWIVVGRRTLNNYLKELVSFGCPLTQTKPLPPSGTRYNFGTGHATTTETLLFPARDFETGSEWLQLEADVVPGDLPFIAGYLFLAAHSLAQFPSLNKIFKVQINTPENEPEYMNLFEIASCTTQGSGHTPSATWLSLLSGAQRVSAPVEAQTKTQNQAKIFKMDTANSSCAASDASIDWLCKQWVEQETRADGDAEWSPGDIDAPS